MVAVDLKTAPKLSTDGNTYTFEGAVSGYYSDPVPASQRNNRLQRSQSTHVTTQYFYADVSPRLERVLGSMQPSTKVFVDGDYRFPVEGESTPGYIEVRNVTFNTTNRSAQGGAPTDGTKASGGTAGNRRSVALKSSPAKPICLLCKLNLLAKASHSARSELTTISRYSSCTGHRRISKATV